MLIPTHLLRRRPMRMLTVQPLFLTVDHSTDRLFDVFPFKPHPLDPAQASRKILECGLRW